MIMKNKTEINLQFFRLNSFGKIFIR